MQAPSLSPATYWSPRRVVRVVAVVAAVAASVLGATSSQARAAQSRVGLATADSYAVLAHSTITNTGPSTINGDVGLSPGTSITGFPNGTINGTTHVADAAASLASTDLGLAYTDAAGRNPAAAVTADLGNNQLSPGVYNSGSSLGLTGVLKLDAGGDPNAVFIFQAGSSLTTATGSSIQLLNGAQSCNVFWVVGSDATLGASSTFVGTLMASSSISMDDAVTVDGRALAMNGAVTLINDTINLSRCAAGTVGGPSLTPTGGGSPTGTTGGTTGGTDRSTGPGVTGGGGTATSHDGTATLTKAGPSTSMSGGPRCNLGSVTARVTGRRIQHVTFSIGTKVVAARSHAPWTAVLQPTAGLHMINARVTFSDATRAVTLHLRVRSCAPAAGRAAPAAIPIRRGGFTG